MYRLLRVSVLFVMLCVVATSRAAEAPAGIEGSSAAPAHPGFLTALSRRGVTGRATITGLWIGDVAGGVGRGGVYNTLGSFATDVDLARLSGWKGGRACASIAWIRGRSATWEFVGDALAVSNLDGFDSIRLYEAWIEQSLLADRLSLRVGVLGADGEFCGSESGALFTNSGFGWSAGIGANVVNGGPIYFAPALGARAMLRPAAGWSLSAGVWDGDSFDSPDGDPLVNEHGTHFDLSPSQGQFQLGEACREWNKCEHATGAPGCTKLGVWRHTADFSDNRLDLHGDPIASSGLDPAVHHGNHGSYGLLEQRVWSETADRAQGLSAWSRLAFAAADRSTFSWVGDGGLNWTGLFRGRDDDVLGVGIVNAVVSPEAAAAVREANQASGGSEPVPDFERVLEFAYRFKVSGRLSVTPDVQWVQHPGTTRATPDALVPGLRVTLE